MHAHRLSLTCQMPCGRLGTLCPKSECAAAWQGLNRRCLARLYSFRGWAQPPWRSRLGACLVTLLQGISHAAC